MTSNIGSPIIQEYFLDGKTSPANLREMERRVQAEMKKYFRPEFLNRVDDTIIFHSLDEEQLTVIVDIQLQGLEKRLAAQQLSLDLTKSAKQLLAKEGYDPQFGARPLKRTIQEKLLDPLALKLLNGEFKPGDHIKVNAGDGEHLVFSKK
jgi:ATP-dependent Clp protease ATP-binding subunit ClpB